MAPTPRDKGLTDFKKSNKNPLTNPTKYAIIKISKGKSKAKIQSVRLEKFLGKAEKKS